MLKTKFLTIPLWQWLAMGAATALFMLFPQLDLWISDLFYDGQRFVGNGTAAESFFYRSVGPVIGGIYGGALLLWLYNRFAHRSVAQWSGRKLLYVLLVLGLGSGLIVNEMLKEHLGRVRPARTVAYGGDKPFTPLFVPTDHPGYSCTSGHAAAAFSLLAFAMLARRRRKLWFTLVLLYGAAVGLARISAGGHFFSDVMGSLFIMYITAGALYRLLFELRVES
jgi:lipid A 4'-phosphatase